MKKIIKVGLLSTVGLFHVVSGSELSDSERSSSDAWIVEGIVVVGESEAAVMGVEDPVLTEAVGMVQAIRDGFVPTEIFELFEGFSKVDVSQRANPSAMQAMFETLRNSLRAGLDDDSVRRLNIMLKVIATPVDSSFSVIPLAQEFFGTMDEELTADPFFACLVRTYNALFVNDGRMVIAHINTPADWATVQFLGLFFDNAISNLRFNVRLAGLDSVDLIQKIISGLNGAATLNVLGVCAFPEAQQVEILRAIAEIRPKHTQIIAAIDNVADLESFVTSFTDPSLQTFSAGSKIDISLIVNFQHRELNERIASLTAMFERLSDRAVPYAWDLMLKLNGFENIAYGDLTPVIRSIVRSPMGANLSLPTLVSDHPTTKYVMTRLKQEFLAPESKVQVLDFKGSQLSAEGWEQLALLAETQKSFKKIRLTGMQIPSSVAGRLGMLRVQGVSMAGCGVKAADLTDMVAGWLGEGSTLRGVDMCGNEVNDVVASLFVEKGFEVYLQDRKRPYGYMFARS
jgi:hypothetical protein